MHRAALLSARLFVSTVEAGSIARAARCENIVASAISKRLSDLEAIIGVALLERGPQGVTPTAAGEAFLHHARQLLRVADAMQQEMEEYGEGVRGHLRVRASSSALSAGLPADIQSFAKQHPEIRIELEEFETPALMEDILQGRAEIGIGPNIFRPEALTMMPWRGYNLAAVLPAGHVLARRRRLTYAALLTYEQVEQSASTALSQLLDYAAKQGGMIKRSRIRVRGFEAVCRMIAAGMGVGVAPSFLQESQSRLYGLRFVELDEAWARPQICIIWRQAERLPRTAQLFANYLLARGDTV
ncbi:LysR family transcriptional regulator [Pseudoroseomonas globiformis]|uniref:LysR family transcriptional regulator n=1 Tax=Teichococcus globiformis TaxID=2307229 RepID=A0ABV7FW51_9PROT